ncbi:MAG: homogentisate 1,2-dioxygenase [Burkholderiaceae bacterium]
MALDYQAGFGNQYQTESITDSLPLGRSNPQRVAHGLYAEQISGSAFTAPRADNRRSWLYRRQPSAVVGRYQPYAQPQWRTGAAGANPGGAPCAPEPLRWNPFAWPDAPCDFVDGMHTIVANGDAAMQAGVAAHVYLAKRSMGQRAFVNADGELLILPQQGALRIVTELGLLDVKPGELALIPRGLVFKVELDDDAVKNGARGYVCENYGAQFRLPELGPIGSNGLANARDFQAPVAATEREDVGSYELIKKHSGAMWQARLPQTPFNVVAWHGNLAPVRYDTANFMTIGSISFDHPDPSIFTVLMSPSDTPGTANCDFAIFPPRWLVMEDTFRPPWYHRNLMSEFMGLIHGEYDAKPQGFKPGGASLHNCMVPHGPDEEAFDKASNATNAPQKLDHTLAFMFESRYLFVPTDFALHGGALDPDYADCWAGLGRRAAG